MIKTPWKVALVGLLALAVQTGTGCAPTTASPAISTAAPPNVAPKAPTTAPSVGPVAGQPWTNSLAVKFVPAGTDGVLFSVWDVRVKDFKAFVDATGYDATAKMISLDTDGWKARGNTWKDPGFAQTDDCPVVGVNLNDAKAFCAWLTKKEQAEGKLGANQMYRLPYDAEWSKAVGLNESSEGTPQSKSLSKSFEMDYPWGKEWPPPKGAGNYAGSEAKDAKWFSRDLTIKGYDDGYPRTSPVGSFPANPYGLYDMGGNVWQWCDDKYTNQGAYVPCMVQRGSSWMNYNSDYLLSIFRNYIPADVRTSCSGMRIVVVVSPPAATSPAASPTAAAPRVASPRVAAPPVVAPPIGAPVAGRSWTSSQGVKFVPAGTDGVLFSVWDVRVKDFKAFVDATGYDATAKMVSLDTDGWKARGDSWKSPGFPQTDDCPVVGVNLDDAKAFCAWLTKKEQAEGKLGANQLYRLPYDAEWSKAVNLKESEGSPKSKAWSSPTDYPWGKGWPPPKDAGNYAGSEANDAKWYAKYPTIKGYVDKYPRTSPVGRFPANPYGLYDMGGNVWQWCDDNYDDVGRLYWDTKVQRGCSWCNYNFDYLPLRNRNYIPAASRTSRMGFRLVLAVSPPVAAPPPVRVP